MVASQALGDGRRRRAAERRRVAGQAAERDATKKAGREGVAAAGRVDHVHLERGHLLRTTVEAARSNPKTIERMARANLGYAKPGEIVIRFEDPTPRR